MPSSPNYQRDYKFGGWNGAEILTIKSCVVCRNSFQPQSGVHKFCSTSCRGKWKYLTGTGNTENQYKSISGDFRKYYRRLVQKDRRDVLSVENLLEIHGQQSGKCALSGEILTCQLIKGVVCKTNASIDRINAGKEYTKDNIRLVCRALNSWRGDTPTEEFIEWCRKVVDHSSQEQSRNA